MRSFTRIGFAFALMVDLASMSLGQQASIAGHKNEEVKAYLRSYLNVGGKSAHDKATKVTIAVVNTNPRDAEEFIVYLSGGGWCGSGGCMMLVLKPTGSSFRVIGRVTIVHLPISILASTHYGRPDIGVLVAGGGVLSPYTAVLSFNGRRYPGNPSVLPAREEGVLRGKVLIGTADEGVSLYD